MGGFRLTARAVAGHLSARDGDALGIAEARRQNFEHADHAAKLVVRRGSQGQLERWRDAEIGCLALYFVELHSAPRQVNALVA